MKHKWWDRGEEGGEKIVWNTGDMGGVIDIPAAHASPVVLWCYDRQGRRVFAVWAIRLVDGSAGLCDGMYMLFATGETTAMHACYLLVSINAPPKHSVIRRRTLKGKAVPCCATAKMTTKSSYHDVVSGCPRHKHAAQEKQK